MASLIMSARDLEFLLHEWLDVESLTRLPRFAEHSRETFDAVLELSERLATERFAPHNRASDLNEPTFDGSTVSVIPEVGEAIRAFAAADLVGATFDAEVGGLQLPMAVFSACMAWFNAANVATTGYSMLTSGNARVLLSHASPEIVERFVEPMLSGRFTGTMALSEPESGSNLADITTRAEPQDDGTYRITGQKMWISGGDHELTENIVHLVLAKIPGGPPGTKGISLFVVPKILVDDDGSLGARNNVVLTGINHKMGFRGTVNTAPAFQGSVGYLVGEPHRGLAYMFQLMNEARIGVGAGAAALGYTGYLKSLDYARTRLQGRPVGSGPDTPQVPLVAHADVRRMLLAQKSYVEGAMALVLFASRLVDEDTDESRSLLGILTPVVKSWPSQWGPAANDLAIQVLGGAGYTRDFDVEQHYRDNRLNPIHEGTLGIQGQDLLGRKVLADGGRGLGILIDRIRATTTRAAAFPELATQLSAVVDQLAETTAAIGSLGTPERMLADATVYLEASGHVVVAWLWLDQLLATVGKEGPFYEGKRRAAQYFFARELPKVSPMLDLLASGESTPLEMDPAWF